MKEQENVYHTPVLLQACMEGLNIFPSGIYADLTFGGGGHSREILRLLGDKGKLYGFDQDAAAERNIPKDARFTFVRSNFCYLQNFMRLHGCVGCVDGVLADLGVSSHHFDAEDRGFSFRFDGQLDMRMNRRGGKTAADVLNTYEETALSNLFYLYGELRSARKLAASIVVRRKEKPFVSVGDLLDVAQGFISKEKEKRMLAQVFQALRIEVNREMDVLQTMLKQALQVLKPGGRLVVLTYHSLEDRMVKHFLRSGNMEGKVEKDFFGNIQSPFRLIHSKPIVPTDEEVEANPRSRSAKLRIAEKRETE